MNITCLIINDNFVYESMYKIISIIYKLYFLAINFVGICKTYSECESAWENTSTRRCEATHIPQHFHILYIREGSVIIKCIIF